MSKSIIERAREKAQLEIKSSLNESNPMAFAHETPVKRSAIPDKTEQVLVMNNTTGTLVMHNKTTKEVRTLELYGSKEYYDVAFLMGIKTILAEGQLIIIEEDAEKPVTKFLLPHKEVRESILTDDEVTEVLNTMDGREFHALLETMHPSISMLLCELVYKLHIDGELYAKDSYGVRDAVTRHLGKPELFVAD